MQGVGRIYDIKHRHAHVPLSICVADVADVSRYFLPRTAIPFWHATA